MTRTKLFTAVAACVLAVPMLSYAQANRGGTYVFHSDRLGQCPKLDWRVNVDRHNGHITGTVGWEDRTADVNGRMQKNGKFHLTAHEAGSGHSADVAGTSAGDHLTLTIHGIGGRCDNTTVQVPRATGGGG